MIQAKALKEHFGLEMIASLLAVAISVGGVIAYQSRTNGVTAASIDNLAEAQKQARAEVAKDLERQTKANNEAIARIETLVGKTVDVSQQNRDEMRSLRDSLERRIGLVEQKADSGWNWTVELKNRVGILEAERQQRKEK